MTIMDDETLQMYVEESKEHLETIESDLLEIEQGGESIDEDLVNKVFRAAHSIKGGASFLGLSIIKELSHKIENVLDMVRNFELTPTPEIVNILLKSFDYLGVLFNDVANSNDGEIETYTTALKDVVSQSLSDSGQDSSDLDTEVEIVNEGTPFTLTKFDLEQARKGGRDVYILKIDLIHDVQRKDKTPMEFINGLGEMGVILDTYIALNLVGDLDSQVISPTLPLHILFATVVEQELLASLLELDKSHLIYIEPGQEISAASLELPPIQPLQKENTPEKLEESVEITPQEVTMVPTTQEQEITPPEPLPKKEVPVPKPHPKKETSVKGKSVDSAKPIAKLESLRVPVSVLDQLMNRAGELVLARNELQLAISENNSQTILKAGQRIDQVTSELQESIMLTRMQPVSAIFNKFTRVVRDMARDLGKQMVLSISGSEVELDKSIIEGLGDPLTHLVRNSCDHGIESPEDRLEKGKSEEGRIALRALHESGQVIIEIEDDGKGLDPNQLTKKAIGKGLITEEQATTMTDTEKVNLIMLPGFSTAEKITDVSGRGVGMDVVKTNLDLLGGQIELKSEIDKGTIIRIKLPLTLAIMPSLLVEASGERYALPQVNVAELLRIPAADIRKHIDKVGGADVLVLRGEMIPLLQLSNVLNLTSMFYDRKTGIFRPDRRQALSDQRLLENEEHELDNISSKKTDGASERRQDSTSDISIVVMQSGSFRFGLVVEKVHDTVEIVVKPLGRHLANCDVYAGATIMGDGHVALILDVAGLGKRSKLRSLSEQASAKNIDKTTAVEDGTARQTLLTFRNGPNEVCAVPLHLVVRLEEIETRDIKIKGGKKVVQYRGKSLPVYALEEVASVEMLEERSKLNVIIFQVAGREVGLLATPPLDVIEQSFVLDEVTLKQPGISGSTIINNETILLIDIFDFMKSINPEWFEEREMESSEKKVSIKGAKASKNILLAEDSTFFRKQVKQFMESEGYTVFDFQDGKEAWEYLSDKPDNISLVVTDLEMPEMNGFELTQNIKQTPHLEHLKVIALTSLAGEEDILKGKEVGIDDYQVKLDKERLLQSIFKYL